MSNHHFKEIRAFVSYLMCCPEHRDLEPWWKMSTFVDEFNRKCFQHITAGDWKVLDKSLFEFCPHMSYTGGLLTLMYIFQKPKQFGVEVKCICDAQTGIMIGMEIQHGKLLFFKRRFVVRITISQGN